MLSYQSKLFVSPEEVEKNPHNLSKASRKQSRKFACPKCNKLHRDNFALQRHSRTHKTKEEKERDKPHPCPHCDKKFHQKSNMRTHIHTHTGQRSYKCEYCVETFRQLCHLQRHHEKKHFPNLQVSFQSPFPQSPYLLQAFPQITFTPPPFHQQMDYIGDTGDIQRFERAAYTSNVDPSLSSSESVSDNNVMIYGDSYIGDTGDVGDVDDIQYFERTAYTSTFTQSSSPESVSDNNVMINGDPNPGFNSRTLDVPAISVLDSQSIFIFQSRNSQETEMIHIYQSE